MGTRIIRQDDGKYGLFSTISDRIYAIDCTREEMIQIWRERAVRRAEQEMSDWLDSLEDHRHFRASETLTLNEALKKHTFHSAKVRKIKEYAGEAEFDDELRKLKEK